MKSVRWSCRAERVGIGRFGKGICGVEREKVVEGGEGEVAERGGIQRRGGERDK